MSFQSLKIPTASENTNRISENTHSIYLKMAKCRLTRLTWSDIYANVWPCRHWYVHIFTFIRWIFVIHCCLLKLMLLRMIWTGYFIYDRILFCFAFESCNSLWDYVHIYNNTHMALLSSNAPHVYVHICRYNKLSLYIHFHIVYSICDMQVPI